jgi:small subunit ribosomal protein S13
MPYLLNTEINEKKRINVGLSRIFGVGLKKTEFVCSFLGISKKTRIKSLNTEITNKIVTYIEKNIKINQELTAFLNQSTEKKIKMKSYKGQRIKLKLPVRGQRTHTNAKTSKKNL